MLCSFVLFPTPQAFQDGGPCDRLTVDLDVPFGPVDEPGKNLRPMQSYEYGILRFDAANGGIPGKCLVALDRRLIAGMGDDFAGLVCHAATLVMLFDCLWIA